MGLNIKTIISVAMRKHLYTSLIFTYFSARKENKVMDPFQHMQKKAAVQEKKKLDEVRMYSVHKIYAGINEYSFEELRAVHWRNGRKKEEKGKLKC